jgi:hypothetical protein
VILRSQPARADSGKIARWLNAVYLPLFERTLEVRRKLKVSAHIGLAA